MVSIIHIASYQPAERSRGFGLVELMIALALGTVIILGVTTLFSDSSRALNDISRAGRQIENSLYAMDLIAKEIALVDYWGEANAPVDAGENTYGPLRPLELGGLETDAYPAEPPLCAGTGATGFDPRVELGFAMEYPLLTGLGSEVNAALAGDQCKAGGSTASATKAYFAVRRASTCATGLGGIAADNGCRAVDDFFYLQTNGCYDPNTGLSGGEVKMYRSDAASLDSNLDYDGFCVPGEAAAEKAPVYRFVSRIYYVNQQDQLVRLSFDNTATGGLGYYQEILVEGVEDLQFEWFLDETGDGVYDSVRSSRRPAEMLDFYQVAGNVVGARVWLAVRSTRENSGYEDDRTYTMAGDPWAIPDGMAAYPRTIQSRMVELPNRVGRRR